jgi:hypothetical protein
MFSVKFKDILEISVYWSFVLSYSQSQGLTSFISIGKINVVCLIFGRWTAI